MKILITNIHLVAPNGSEISTKVIADELKSLGHTIYLWSPSIGDFHLRMLREYPTITPFNPYNPEPKDWMEEKFDIAILQHLNHTAEDETFVKQIRPTLPRSDKIILMCHGIAAPPETPRIEPWLEGAKYTCISEEIMFYHPKVEWNLIRQPIDPSWFDLKLKKPNETGTVEKIVWASHRHPIPERLRDFCIANQIGLYACGHRPVYPKDIQEIYEQVDLVFGTGRWIYEGMAAGLPCVVADSGHTLGYVDISNVESFQQNNMTLRHSSAKEADWTSLIEQYTPDHGFGNKEHALQFYHVSKVVDRLLASVGEESVEDIVGKVYE